jgi:hypothetical protein
MLGMGGVGWCLGVLGFAVGCAGGMSARSIESPSGVPVRAHAGQPARPRSSLESPAVQAVVAAHHAEFAACYEPAASLDPDRAGVVALEFGLHPDGRVAWVESTSHTRVFDSEVVDCVVSTFARLPFAAPDDSSRRGAFSFVFGLSPDEG